MIINFILPGPCYQVSGGTKVIYTIASELVKRGHVVRLYHPRKTKKYTCLKDWLRHLKYLLIRPNLKWARIDKRVEIYYIYEPVDSYIDDADFTVGAYWLLYPYLKRLSSSKGKRCYYAQHYEANYWGPKHEVDKMWRDDEIIKFCVSKWLMDIGKRLGAKNLFYISNAISHDVFYNQNLERKYEVCFMWSDKKWKMNGDWKHQPFPCVVFGVGKRPNELPHRVLYIQNPSQETLAKIYNQSRHFLYMSESEGFGLPGLEAKACGCRLIGEKNTGPLDYWDRDPKEFNWRRTTDMFLEALSGY